MPQQQRRDKLPYASERRAREGREEKQRRKLVAVRRRCTVLSRTSTADARRVGWRGWRWRKKGRSRGERPPPRTRSLAPRLVSLGQSSAAESRAKHREPMGRERKRERDARSEDRWEGRRKEPRVRSSNSVDVARASCTNQRSEEVDSRTIAWQNCNRGVIGGKKRETGSV